MAPGYSNTKESVDHVKHLIRTQLSEILEKPHIRGGGKHGKRIFSLPRGTKPPDYTPLRRFDPYSADDLSFIDFLKSDIPNIYFSTVFNSENRSRTYPYPFSLPLYMGLNGLNIVGYIYEACLGFTLTTYFVHYFVRKRQFARKFNSIQRRKWIQQMEKYLLYNRYRISHLEKAGKKIIYREPSSYGKSTSGETLSNDPDTFVFYTDELVPPDSTIRGHATKLMYDQLEKDRILKINKTNFGFLQSFIPIQQMETLSKTNYSSKISPKSLPEY